MDASELTRRRRARTLYTNNIYRQNAIASGVITNKPATSGNQIGDKNGVDYNEWKNYITVGPTTISRAELDVIFAEPPAPTPPSVYKETFAVFASQDSSPNWFYRVYNATTNLWSALIDTGYPTATWTNDDTASAVNYFCVTFYNIDTTGYDFFFVDGDGLIVNTISTPDNNNSYEFTRNYLFINDENTSTLQIYNPLTQILQTATLSIASYYTLDNGVFLIGTADGPNTSYYMWGLGSTDPQLITNHITGRGYTVERAIHDDIMILITYSGETYADKVYLISSNGEWASYDLPADTYNDVSVDFYGINNKFVLLKFTADDNSVTYNRFQSVIGPLVRDSITLTNPTNYSEFYYSRNNQEPSYQSNHLVIVNYAPNTNVSYIFTGGGIFGNDNASGPFEFDISGGNYMKLSAGRVVADPELRIQPDFIIDSAIYGSHKKYTDESGRFAGYVVGSDTAGNPHTSLVYTQNGIAQIGISGAYAHAIGGDVTLLSSTYNAGGGVEGSWRSITRVCTGDGPTNCEVWFTIEKSSWSTDVDTISDRRQSDGTDKLYESSIDVSGVNFVLGKVMLAATQDNTINDTQIVNYLQAYVADAIPHLFTDPADFTTISGEAFKTWHDLSGGDYWSNITNPYIYTYDQNEPMPIPQFSAGTAYVSISGENFQTFNYTAPNLLSTHIGLNESAVMIIEGNSNTNKQSSRIFTSLDLSGTSVDLSGNLPTNPYSALNNIDLPYVFQTQTHFIYFNTENFLFADPNWFPVGTSYYVISNSNEQIYHEVYGPAIFLPFFGQGVIVASGNNFATIAISLVAIYTNGPVDLTPFYTFFLRDSVLTKYSDYLAQQIYTNQWDNASGVMFGYRDNEDDTSTIVTMTNTDITGTTIELPYSVMFRYQTADHFIILAGDDLRIRIWDSAGTLYSYTPTTPISIHTYDCRVLSTSTKICFFLLIDPTELWFYVIFDIVTNTYTDSRSQNIESSLSSARSYAVNYPFSVD